MRLLQLHPTGQPEAVLDLHPMVTVVTSLSASGRERLLHAVAALVRGADPGSEGLLESHGIFLPYTVDMLKLLDLSRDLDVIVRPQDLIAQPAPGRSTQTPQASEGASAWPSVEEFLAATPAGVFPDLDQMRYRQAQAREALGLLRQAAREAHQSLEEAQVHRKRAEHAVELAGQGVRRPALRLVGGRGEPGQSASPGSAAEGWRADEPLTDAGPAALHARRDELVKAIEHIDQGIGELTAVDVRPIQVLLEAVHHPAPVEYEPSLRGAELADELAARQGEVAALEESLDARGLGSASAMARADAARAEVANAERAMRPPQFTDEDRVELEAAHDGVLDAERKARGRGGKKRLEEAIGREQAVLDRMGFPTWSAYVMGSSLMSIDAAAEQRLDQARFALDQAERHWADVAAMIEADPVHRELLDRLESVYVEAWELLGGEDPNIDLEARLRTLQVPRRDVSTDELVDALAYQLELLGLGVPPQAVTLDRVVRVAEAFLEEAAAIQDRIAELGGERLEALTELHALDELMARGELELPEPHESLGTAAPMGGPVAPDVAAHEVELAARERELRDALEDERVYADMVEARDALVDAAIQVETVATGRLHRRASEAAEAAAGRDVELGDNQPVVDTDTDAGGAAPNGGEAAGMAVGDVVSVLRSRFEAHGSVSFAGSVPVVLDDALSVLADDDIEQVLDRLSADAATVQIIVVSDHPRVTGWVERAGFEVGAVIPSPAGFN